LEKWLIPELKLRTYNSLEGLEGLLPAGNKDQIRDNLSKKILIIMDSSLETKVNAQAFTVTETGVE
jgi:hypothetical protein